MGNFCKNCGNQLDDNSKFCEKCGTQTDANIPPLPPESKPYFPPPPSRLRTNRNRQLLGCCLFPLIVIFVIMVLGAIHLKGTVIKIQPPKPNNVQDISAENNSLNQRFTVL